MYRKSHHVISVIRQTSQDAPAAKMTTLMLLKIETIDFIML